MGPLSQHDRSAVELTMRLLDAASEEWAEEQKRLKAQCDAINATYAGLDAGELWYGVVACRRLLALDDQAKAPPDPGVAAPGSST